MKPIKIGILLGLTIFLFACEAPEPVNEKPPEGKLFIMGDGKIPPGLIAELVSTSGINSAGYAMILPMTSVEPDSAAFYAIKQFTDHGLPASTFIRFPFPDFSKRTLNSLKNATLIYITGGSHMRFMDNIAGTGVAEAIREAFKNGATIAGAGAGAAVMSQLMIAGDENKHSENTEDFRATETDNLILKPGLGLLEKSIIDQHFVYRMRMNRLMTVILENPEQIGIGIDESTAMVVEGNQAKVVGKSRVIVLQNTQGENEILNGLVEGKSMDLGIYLPGETFELKNNLEKDNQ